ncbi:MAG: thermonuclease family protein [Planctomycetaceae bacterium]
MRRARRPARWRRWLLPLTPSLVVGLALAGWLAWRLTRWPPPDPAAFVDVSQPMLVTDVEGDGALRLEDGRRVRMIGVGMPDPSSPAFPRAIAFLHQQAVGRHVRLELDRERRDSHRRLLAYVYVGEMLLNEELIRAGHARADLASPYSSEMQRHFRAAEDAARLEKRGLWAEDPPLR